MFVAGLWSYKLWNIKFARKLKPEDLYWFTIEKRLHDRRTSSMSNVMLLPKFKANHIGYRILFLRCNLAVTTFWSYVDCKHTKKLNHYPNGEAKLLLKHLWTYLGIHSWIIFAVEYLLGNDMCDAKLSRDLRGVIFVTSYSFQRPLLRNVTQ